MTRRVVTGYHSGKAVVLYDGPAPNCKLRQATGLVSTLIWVTDESPTDLSGGADRAAREIGVAPPPGGTIFRIVDFPPGRKEMSRDSVLQELGLSNQKESKYPGMHRTRSIDYAVVLEGSIDMLLEDSEVHLRAGDVLVQQGTSHAWVNRGATPCRIAFVLIDAKAFPA
jgi:mannose-6-phosphate isomerase-like protein (cupin superfamily)